MFYIILSLFPLYLIIQAFYFQFGLSEFLIVVLLVVIISQKKSFQKEKKINLDEYQKEKYFVNKISQILRGTLEFDEVLKAILNTLASKLGHKNILVYLLEKENDREYLKCIAFSSAINIDGINALHIPAGSGIISAGKKNKNSKIIDLNTAKYAAERKILNMKKIGVSPMVIRNEIIGFLIFELKSSDFDLSEVDLFSSHSAIAIDNAKMYSKIKESSIVDELTKVYNQRYFYPALLSGINLSQKYKSHLSVLMIDIDDFKNYNDTNGHLAGDDCLYRVAQILEANTRNTDIVARYGGEEFAIILHGIDKKGVIFTAEKLRKAIETYEFPHGKKQPFGKLTISIGIATYPADAADYKKLVNEADKYLYKAKEAGKNRVMYAGL